MMYFFFVFLDVDECAGDNECHANAQCTNTLGGYTCACRDGYEGDGRNCTGEQHDVDRNFTDETEVYLVFCVFLK